MGQVVYKGPDEALDIVCEDGTNVRAEKNKPVDVPEGDENRLLERDDFGKQAPAKSATTKKETD